VAPRGAVLEAVALKAPAFSDFAPKASVSSASPLAVRVSIASTPVSSAAALGASSFGRGRALIKPGFAIQSSLSEGSREKSRMGLEQLLGHLSDIIKAQHGARQRI